ncbi:MAG: hypothetical protein NT007_03080 [Candidatus Kapabacteria bacterium]|nr:hypothetical protein [Candidatus Kapabacteria bacterium]
MKKIMFIGILFTALIGLSACTSISNVKAIPKSMEIIIDGNSSEWENALIYFQDEKLLAGFIKDKDNLYVCIKASDATTIRKIMSNGMTLWINNKSDDSKPFGLHYPIGMKGVKNPGLNKNDSRNRLMPNNPDLQKDKKSLPQDSNNRKHALSFRDIGADELEFVFTEGADKRRLTCKEAEENNNIRAFLKIDEEALVYELSIPLKSEYLKYNAIEKKPITIGIETGTVKHDEEDSRKHQNMGEIAEGGPSVGVPMGGGAGGMYPGGGMGGSMGGGRGRGGRGSFSNYSESKPSYEPIKIWLNVIME